jgi:CHAT domain-containing protein
LRNFEIQVQEKRDNAKPVSLSEIQQRLSADTALIEFLFVGEKVFALVISKTDLQTVSLPISKSNLAAKTKLFRSLIFSNEENENDWLPVAESLCSGLIEPIEKVLALQDVKRIGFIPYGFLHDLPFAALAHNDNGNTKFLVEDYALFQTPSATFYAHKSKSVPPVPTGGTDLLTLAFGRNESNEENLPALELAAEESQSIAQTTNGVAFTNKQATETEFKRRADDCDVLHLSTHAIAESDMPLFSRLLLEPTDSDDGNLTVKEIFELGLKTKLVTLSACETGQSFSASGNVSNEQDRIGLIEAFLQAGSKSVLASLFPVSDRPTTEFMKVFYQNLQTQDTAESLSKTQRAMLRDDKLKHPRYWSPFILVGTDR